MSALRCTLCRRDVPDGFCQCPYCNVGFTAALECAACGSRLQAGNTTCPRCSRPAPEAPVVQLSAPTSLAPQVGAPPRQLVPQVGGSYQPGLVPATRVEETYLAGHYGVDSQVSIPAGDVELMNLMAQAADALQALAARMNGFRGHMDLTRRNIRSCRSLAIDLQEEIELRRGPRG